MAAESMICCHKSDVRLQREAAAHGMPPSKDKIIIKIIRIIIQCLSRKHIRAARNYQVSCDCISVEINCYFNFVSPSTNADKP